MTSLKTRNLDLCFSASIVIATFLLSIQGVGFWRWDDPQIVYFALTYNPFDYFFDPAIYRQFSGNNFTPWVILSFAMDQVLALDPIWHYLHQSLALSALAVLYYCVVRIWLKPVFGLCTAVLFVSGLGFFLCTIQLMTRHYVEGMIFCLAAILLYHHGVKKESLLWMLVSATLYLFAMLAKEFYAPLPLLLFFIDRRPVGKRVVFLLAHAIAALTYILWRLHMLGLPGDVYGVGFSSISLASVYPLVDVPLLLYGAAGSLIVSALMLYLAWKTILARNLQGFMSFMALGVCILLPLVPLAMSVGFKFHLRYLLVPHAAIAMLAGLAIQQLAHSHGRTLAVSSALTLFGFTVFSTVQGSASNIASANAFDVQSRFLWEQDASNAVRPSLEYALSYYHYAFLTDLKRERFGISSPPVLIRPAFAASYPNVLRLKAYSLTCQCMIDDSLNAFRSQNVKGGFLESILVREANTFRWNIAAAEPTGSRSGIPAPTLPFAGAGQGVPGYKLCAIVLNNGVTTGMVLTTCGGVINTVRQIRGAELLTSDLLFMAITKDERTFYSKIYRRPESKNE